MCNSLPEDIDLINHSCHCLGPMEVLLHKISFASAQRFIILQNVKKSLRYITEYKYAVFKFRKTFNGSICKMLLILLIFPSYEVCSIETKFLKIPSAFVECNFYSKIIVVVGRKYTVIKENRNMLKYLRKSAEECLKKCQPFFTEWTAFSSSC